jgi:hypothetical protein
MFDVSSGFGLPDIFENAGASGDELRGLSYADSGVEIADFQHGEPERGGPCPKPLDTGLSFVYVAASEVSTVIPSIAAPYSVWLEFPFA